MLKESKFTPRQIMLLYMVSVMGTANFFVPAATAELAGRDGWLSIIAITLPSLFIVFILTTLALRYPNVPFSISFERIIGKYPGKLLSLLYIFFMLVVNASIVREFLSFISTTILPQTPHGANALGLLIAVCFLLRKDLSVVGKVADILAYIFLGSFLVIFLLLINKFQFQNILPILDRDVVQVLKPLIVPTVWNGEVIFLIYYLFYCDNIQKAAGKLYLGAVGIVFFKLLMITSTIWVFGEAQNLRLPVFSIGTMINVANFVRNLDAIIIIAWVTGIFIKVSVFQGAVLLSLRHSFRLNNYRFLVLPSLFIIYALANSMFRGTNDITKFLLVSWPYFGLTFELVIPALLLIISFIRGDKSGSSNNNYSSNSSSDVRASATN